jgi:hypothetical protein
LFSQITVTVGKDSADYPTLFDVFDRINDGSIDGNGGDIVVQIVDSTIETRTAVLYESGYSTYTTYSSVTIYPTVGGKIVSGDFDGTLIELNNATNVTIDGRVNLTGTLIDLKLQNASSGTSSSCINLTNNTASFVKYCNINSSGITGINLVTSSYNTIEYSTIINTNNGSTANTSTIMFIDDASNNTVQFCTIKGSETNASSGIIFFSTTTGSTGNDNNIIDNNNITNSSNANRPIFAIYSLGTTSMDNSGNIISNNNIFDFLNKGISSNGILISSNNTAWTISGNSFYETSSFAPSAEATYNIIQINNTSGNSFIVSGNYIGGSAALCTGSSWTKTSAYNSTFNAIDINVGTSAVSTIFNNTIAKINWSNPGNISWWGIDIGAGNVNIGSDGGNIFGETDGNGSITVTNGTSGAILYAINITSTGVVNCQNNIVRSITAENIPTGSSYIYVIYKSSVLGNVNISNNTIGSANNSNSIFASSTSTNFVQSVLGIYCAGTGSIIINNNLIANIANGSIYSTSYINGIRTLGNSASLTCNNNVIHHLSISNANTSVVASASVIGMVLTNSTSKTVSGNTIYDLSNKYSTNTGCVIGIFFTGGTGNAVSGNFIHRLSVTGSSSGGNIYGIKIASGATTYSNNLISLGGVTNSNIYGIYETGAAANNNNLYFNTVYIDGSLNSGTNNSYALYSAVTTNTRNFRNNIFVNARSTTGGSNLHYASYIVNTGGTITCDYNDYFVSGTGGTLGYYGPVLNNRTSLPIVTGQDVNSSSISPGFTNAGSTTSSDYTIGVDLIGVSGTGITTDFGSATRANVPTMGAWERSLNRWKGTSGTDFGTAGNWTSNAVPATDASIIFDDNPSNHCLLDIDRSVKHIFINQGTDRLVTNGNKLTIKENLNLSYGAQIDASAPNSTLEFAGSAAQFIPSGGLLNDQAYNIIVNNANNVTLNGPLNILNSLTAPAGRLDATTNTPTVTFGGTTAQTIASSTFLNDKVTNLTITNSTGGVTLNSNFTVDNALNISSGIFTVAAGKYLTVTGATTNTGTFTLKSDGSGTASLLTGSSSGLGTTNAERYLIGGGWHALSSSVTGQSIRSFLQNGANGIPQKTLNTVVTYGMEYYNEPTGSWTYIDANNIGGAGNFVSGIGYLLRRSSDGVFTFTGTLNSSSISPSTTRTNHGWHAIGNPYPSRIGLNTGTTATNFITANTSNFFDANFIGVYMVDGTVYTLLNNSDVATYLQPGQGFVVKVSPTATNMNFTTAMQAHQNPLLYKKSTSSAWNELTLNVKNDTASAMTIIRFREDMTRGLDPSYDGGFYSNKSDFLLYTRLVEDNGVDFMIQCLSSAETDSMSIPIGFDHAGGGLVTFSASIASLPNGYIAVLEDKVNSTFTDLSIPDSKYEVAVDKGSSGTGRFFLHLVESSNGIPLHNIQKITSFAVKKDIFIKGNVPAGSVASIYDLMGRKLAGFELEESNLNILNMNSLAEGVYIVKVSNGKILQTNRVFLTD